VAYWLLKAVLSPLLRFLFRVRTEGREHMPGRGPVILASNHLSFSDSVFLPLVLRRRVTFVAKAEYFEDPRTAWLFRALGQIPLPREGGSASERALKVAREVLEGGGVFCIYPEGTRSPDGRLHRGHTGVARLALATAVPVVPVAMVGTREAQPIGQAVPNLFMPVGVRLGPPLRFGDPEAADDASSLRRVTDQVMAAIGDLSGQGYVDRYASRGESEGP
jgi:1-acyl-sn-glycerol-3-phosphate acyltransferase